MSSPRQVCKRYLEPDGESLLRVRNASRSDLAIKVRPPAFTRLSLPCESQAEIVQCDTLNSSAASFVVNRSPTTIFLLLFWSLLGFTSPRLYATDRKSVV